MKLSTILILKALPILHALQASVSSIECRLVQADGLLVDTNSSPLQDKSQIGCIDEEWGKLYFFRETPPQDIIDLATTKSGEVLIEIDVYENDGVEFINSYRIKEERGGRYGRKLYQRTGERTGLVVRVTSNDGFSPTFNSFEMSEKIFFGNLTMRTGFSACSGGKLDIIPAVGENIHGGVIDITIPDDVKDVEWKEVQNFVTRELYENKISLANYDNSIIVLPAEVDFDGAAAWAYVSTNIGVYKDTYVQYPFLMVHELSHNLGYRHSGTPESEYGDNTCYMGGGDVGWNDDVNMCFNAAKSWYSGWYSDKLLVVKPTKLGLAFNGGLVALDDYVNGRITEDSHKVVIKIAGNEEVDLFMLFNRAKGINKDVIGYPNYVTIVEQESEQSSSILVAGLKPKQPNDTFRVQNWANTGYQLVIQDCGHRRDSIDYAKIRIYLLLNAADPISCRKSVNNLTINSNVNGDESDTNSKCNQDPFHRFFFRVRNDGTVLSRQCKWLLKKKKARVKELCRKRGSGLGGFRLAHEVCCETCAQYEI